MSFLYFGYSFQDSTSLVMREFAFFHDFALYVVLGVSILVASLLGFVLSKGFSGSNYLENKGLELAWTLCPALVLVLLALPSLKLLFYIESPVTSNPSHTMKVVGHQWYWSVTHLVGGVLVDRDVFMVPSSDLSSGSFRGLEVDYPIVTNLYEYTRFVTTAVDVLHSFAIPSLGMKIDAVPGRLNQQCALPKVLGVFYGQCSEICGANHSFMPVSLEVCLLDKQMSSK